MAALLQSIRAGIAQRLRGRTLAQERVFTNRSGAVWTSGLPALLVYTKSETCERETTTSYKRTARVAIEMVVASGGQENLLDDQADELAEEVELLMFADPELRGECGPLVHEARLVSYDLALEDGGERLYAGARLTWEFVYFQDIIVGDLAALVPWKTARTAYSLDPSGTTP